VDICGGQLLRSYSLKKLKIILKLLSH